MEKDDDHKYNIFYNICRSFLSNLSADLGTELQGQNVIMVWIAFYESHMKSIWMETWCGLSLSVVYLGKWEHIHLVYDQVSEVDSVLQVNWIAVRKQFDSESTPLLEMNQTWHVFGLQLLSWASRC